VDPIGRAEPESLDYERFGLKGGAWPVFQSACRCDAHSVFDSSSKQRLNYRGFRPVRTIFDPGSSQDGGVGRALDQGPVSAAD
jgi:hypothetical protein